jgi:hypothetical protein
LQAAQDARTRRNEGAGQHLILDLDLLHLVDEGVSVFVTAFLGTFFLFFFIILIIELLLIKNQKRLFV